VTASLTERAEAKSISNDKTSSSNFQVSLLDKSVQRKKKKDEDDGLEEAEDVLEEDDQRKQGQVEEAGQKFQMMREQDGVVLRGVIHVLGFDVAVYMNRMSVHKELHSNWLFSKKDKTTGNSSRKFWLADYQMWFKLLHYADEAREPTGKKRTAEKHKETGLQGDLEQVLSSGFIGSVKLVGFWNDAFSHFRLNEMKEKDVSDLSWMHYLMLPWKDLDCRFDTEGASCRADFIEESKGWWGRTFSSEPERFMNFRLDALSTQYDPAKAWVGVTAIDDVDYNVRLHYEQCQPLGKDSFECELEMRPLVVGNVGIKDDKESLEAREQKYISAAGGLGGGPWFSYIGMKGVSNLKFTPDGKGNYQAVAMSSRCGENNPCPFIPHLAFRAQLLAHAVILDAQNGMEPLMLFPVYNDLLMQEEPDGMNIGRLSQGMSSINPVSDAAADDEAATPSPGSERAQERVAAVQQKITEHQETLAHLIGELRDCRSKSGESLVQTRAQSLDTQRPQVMTAMQDELDSLKQEILRLKQM
jgi:hypothetical protein